ncbi:Non-specific serine/threonine protein kinase [Luteimicrobium xylanilyticum]|uniref:Non-specific serine/threonine protein kinase n=1 Tax=Luteimicrobium xylanilyticum TaxID=1133546 RepID=A0A5P9QF64_9MICO|nr:AAA family ATPase [Luteimicrobium xylanilyticum]QFV00134.1 Non-specific serine/threonine protein kinase [Luteimicrobium xylanilyticum]
MAAPASAPFVARSAELELLTDAVRRAAEGEPALVLVGGDAGIGKTRLLTRTAELAQEAGAAVVVSHCVDLGSVGLPFLPFVEALSDLRRRCSIVDDFAAQRPALARLLDADPGATPTSEPAGRLQLLDGLAAVLGGAGAPSSPLVLMIEDIHWADASTLDALRYLVARLRDENLLVVASYRADDLHRRHPLRPVLAELGRHPRVERIELEPFTRDELREFTTAVAGRPLDAAALESVSRRSEGNAYFAEELVESGVRPGELPWTLADVLHARLERLPPDVQRLVRIASADGRQVLEPLVRAVAAGPVLGGAAGADTDSALREAVAQQVLHSDGDRIVFRHALLAEAVYGDLLPGDQVAVHRAYLDALAADPALGSAAVRAYHALRAHDLPMTLVASRDAARQAARVLAPAEERRHLEQVLALWDAVPDAAGLLGEPHDDVALAAASAAARSGAPERAVDLARAVVDTHVGDPLRHASLQHVLAGYLLAADELDEMLDRTASALEVLPVDPPSRDRAWTLAMHARAALNLDLDDIARQDAVRAVADAQAVDAPDVEADALGTLAVLEVDDPERSAELLVEARERAHAAGDLETELRCMSNLVANRYYAGNLDEAARLADEASCYAHDTGMTWSVYGMTIRMFVLLGAYLRGELAPADPGPVPESWAAGYQALQLYPAVARGDADAVERGQALRPAWVTDGQIALVAGGCTVDALVWRGDDEEAVALAEEVIVFLGREWSDSFLGRIWLSALALSALADQAERDALVGHDVAALVAHGDEFLDAAVRTAERGRPRGGVLGPEGRGWLARVHAEHARLQAAGGVGENDPVLWEAAAHEFGFGYRYEVARSRWRWAEALVAAGDRAGASEQLADVLTDAEVMGARPLADACRALARRARLDVGGVRASSSDTLTERESEVMALVAQGLSNRQIGERLFISGKTVSVHVSNVLAKLGAATRAEAVSVAHQRGLLAAR